jgi:L-aspartate oxidase
MDPAMIRQRFPNIFEKAAALGFDMSDRLPVAPAAHYTVGGVKCDLDGRTSLPHLYACGELASTGIMGANRLASNSLVECLVFGHRAVEAARRDRREVPLPPVEPRFTRDPRRLGTYLDLESEVADIMTRDAGIIREEEGMRQGLERLERLAAAIPREEEYFSRVYHNLLTVAGLIIRPALYRRESRGGHFRSDYPAGDDAYLFHLIQQRGQAIRALPVETSNEQAHVTR